MYSRINVRQNPQSLLLTRFRWVNSLLSLQAQYPLLLNQILWVCNWQWTNFKIQSGIFSLGIWFIICFVFPEALGSWLGSLVKRSQSVVMVVLWYSSGCVWWLDGVFPLRKQLHWGRRTIGLPVIIDGLSSGDYIMEVKKSFSGSCPGLPAVTPQPQHNQKYVICLFFHSSVQGYKYWSSGFQDGASECCQLLVLQWFFKITWNFAMVSSALNL